MYTETAHSVHIDAVASNASSTQLPHGSCSDLSIDSLPMQSLSFHTAASMSKRSCVQLHSNGTVSCRVACSLQVRAAFASIWKRIWLITGCVLRCPTSRQSVTRRQSLGGWARITSHQQLATDRPPLARSPSLSHSSAPSLSLPLLLSLPLSLLHVWKLRATWKLHCQLLYTIYIVQLARGAVCTVPI